MQLHQPKPKRRGQSLVEFALVITLIFLITSAAIDFGLAFFAYQGISGAAQEGAAYAALMPMEGDTVNDAEIIAHVRNEAGPNTNIPHRARFVNLFDLNTDGAVDSDNSYIQISSVANAASSGADCTNRRSQFCDMVVTVLYDYKPFFSGATLIGADSIRLSATRQMTISR